MCGCIANAVVDVDAIFIVQMKRIDLHIHGRNGLSNAETNL